jgi:hypothetical protein
MQRQRRRKQIDEELMRENVACGEKKKKRSRFIEVCDVTGKRSHPD